jgi:hypothetical protein
MKSISPSDHPMRGTGATADLAEENPLIPMTIGIQTAKPD